MLRRLRRKRCRLCFQRIILRRSAEDQTFARSYGLACSGHYGIDSGGAQAAQGSCPPCGASAELQPVFAVAFLVVVARGTLASTELAMTVMTMSATFGILRRLKVADWNFVGFAHIAFLQ